ncbi:MAG TPA: glycoside hydrolase family 9 protein [Acidobacteriaceae bacterium]
MNRRDLLKYMSLSGAAVALAGREPLAHSAASTQGKLALNESGYLPESEKIANVLMEDATDRSFQIYSEQAGRSVFRGQLTASSIDAASGDQVALADFSQLTTPGTYRFVAQGIQSQQISISNDVYFKVLVLSIRAFYGQRCGCSVDIGGGYRHAACHHSAAYHPSSGREAAAMNHGGWHDAGDYGRYMVNSAIATATLLWAWELYPRTLRALSLRIPESGGKLPDYLAEIRWNLEWMLSLQDEDGGVWHKQTSEQFCGFILPEDDHLTSYIIGTGAAPYKSTCASAGMAATMAIAARCYRTYDAAFSGRCLAAAKRGWNWAVAHPNVLFANPPGIGTGSYTDSHCNHELLWTSAELWRTTGNRQYEQAFLDGCRALPPETAIAAPSWSNVAPLAYWTYLLSERKGSDQLRSRARAQTEMVAQMLLTRQRSNGYGNTLGPEDYIWGSNSVAANQSLLLLVADHFRPDRRMKEAALGNLHYLLGRNCFGVSWVTHVGTNPFLHPHHRPSIADNIAAPWPGLLSGGPNANPADPVAKNLPKRPPMRMWLDDKMAYSLNEVAINWNAPLVFLLAAANDRAL